MSAAADTDARVINLVRICEARRFDLWVEPGKPLRMVIFGPDGPQIFSGTLDEAEALLATLPREVK